VHVVSIDYEEKGQEGWLEHARDVMQQVGAGIFINQTPMPSLDDLTQTNHPNLRSTKLTRTIEEAGFNGNLLPSFLFSEGGKFIPGSKFWLISDAFGKEVAGALSLDLQMSVYRISPLFEGERIQLENGEIPKKGPDHIDTFYGVVSGARIIYSALPIVPLTYQTELRVAKTKSDTVKKHYLNLLALSTIASQHGYELRYFGLIGGQEKGINFIEGEGIIVTNGIKPEEKAHLAKKGIEAIEVTLTNNAGNSGVRCYYAEVLAPKYPVAQSVLSLPTNFSMVH